MDQEQSNDSHSALLQRWIDVLHRWEEKRSQYQVELDRATDIAHKVELEQGIQACENVIHTSQGLIQALSDWDAPIPDSVLMSTPAGTDPSAPETSQTSSLSSQASPVEAQQRLPAVFEAEPSSTAMLAPRRPSQSRRSRPVTKRSSSRSTLKPFLKVGLPLLIIVAASLAIFRPKNECKLSPDGAYDSTGLATWVQQALEQSEVAKSAQAVNVGQYGCTIVLKGTVSSVAEQSRIIAIAKGIKLPSQAPWEQMKRAFGMESKVVKPVQDVVSQLQVQPSDASAQP